MITRRKPIRRVSKKRASAMVEYRRRRLRFLQEHPYCQVFIAEHRCVSGSEEQVIRDNGWLRTGPTRTTQVPFATEIHHTKKPKATYLNDESTWLAVCREMHEKIENNKAWAREKGYLQNI